jgi:hypothetical protein
MFWASQPLPLTYELSYAEVCTVLFQTEKLAGYASKLQKVSQVSVISHSIPTRNDARNPRFVVTEPFFIDLFWSSESVSDVVELILSRPTRMSCEKVGLKTNRRTSLPVLAHLFICTVVYSLWWRHLTNVSNGARRQSKFVYVRFKHGVLLTLPSNCYTRWLSQWSLDDPPPPPPIPACRCHRDCILHSFLKV